jgi:hypothetical protein
MATKAPATISIMIEEAEKTAPNETVLWNPQLEKAWS